MEKRALLAVFLSLLVLYGYQALFMPPPPEPGQAVPAGPARPVAPTTASAPTAAPVESPPVEAAPAAPSEMARTRGEEAPRDIHVETPAVAAVFTNEGGRLKSWKLKKYFDEQGRPLEIVATGLAASHPLPLSLTVVGEGGDALTRQANSGLYRVTQGRSDGDSGAIRLTLEYAATGVNGGLEVFKELEVSANGYDLMFRASVKRTGVDGSAKDAVFAIDWGPAVGSGTLANSALAKPRGIVAQGGEVERIAASDMGPQLIREGDFQFAGVDDHYFLTAAIGVGAAKVTFRPLSIPAAATDAPAHELVAWSLEPRSPDPVRLYAGPKNFDSLAAIDRDLVRAIDFGMFAIIVVPLLRTLNWINGYVGNYGWAIVILTIIINALMFPLRHKQVVSARKMQEIQPEAKAIQDRYAKLKATDPARQKMNQELMALYRERGVNPAAGCLPILLTLPVFLAFFSLLTVAIELRGAPFIGWIRDLSAPDPYYVIPVLMGLSQVWLQTMTPAVGADPVQQKMMMFMPVIMMVFFLWSPTGALIYWLVGNIWGIGQQYATNYLIGPPALRATARPPAERRVKSKL
jgi:YidC/Oxa1 family membrane protein insertase